MARLSELGSASEASSSPKRVHDHEDTLEGVSPHARNSICILLYSFSVH